MKKCFKCGEFRPLKEFYRHPQMGDGHLNKCKECTKADVRLNYKRSLADPLYQNNQLVRGRDKYHRLYASPEARARQNARVRARRKKMGGVNKFRKAYPEKYRAHSLVGYALKSGKLKRGPCEVCGAVKVDAHHDDYSKPLEVRWLCKKHHAAVHITKRAA